MRTRKIIRLPTYDYSQNGVYFVTICTEKKRKCLVDVRRGGVLPRPAGMVVEKEILALPDRYDIHIDKYVIMPNHVHILMTLQRGGEGTNPPPQFRASVGVFQPLLKKKSKKTGNAPGRKVWQRSYYDHVIRNEADYLRAWQYIDDNPAHWAEDEYYSE